MLLGRLLLGMVWLLHFLPSRAVAGVGEALGMAGWWLVEERRRVTRINLERCFPAWTPEERERIARAHFRAFVRSLCDRGILWWSSPERVARLVRMEGREHLESALQRGPVILLAPHFCGLDAGGACISLNYGASSLYARQKDPWFDRLLFRGRSRFGAQLLPRQAGVRRMLRLIRSSSPFYYLPDMDFGPRTSVFVPFFGVPAATTVGLSFIARATGATVVPCVTRMLPRGGYVLRFYPEWSGFPSGDDAADARRMLAFVEERTLEMPEQYLWMHKRFKTRPQGEPRFY